MKKIRKVVVLRPKQGRIFTNNSGWRTIAGRKIYFRSGWEVSFAWHLQFLKENNQIQEWEHEPYTFWFHDIKRGTRSYLPDFKVTRIDGSHYWIEVKGYMDAKSRTKIKRFHKYYPKEELFIIDYKWFREFREKFPMLTEKWENQFTEGER